MTGGRVQDIVAFFPQGEPTEPNRLSFVEHVNRGEKKIFSVSTTAPPSTKVFQYPYKFIFNVVAIAILMNFFNFFGFLNFYYFR
jgi:hypothetical protein